VQAPVDGDLLQVQADDAVAGGDGFVAEAVEHAGLEPLVPPGAQRGLAALAQAACDVPGATRDQPDQDALEARPVGDAPPVAAEGMGVGRALRQDRADGGQDGVDNSGIEGEHAQLLPEERYRRSPTSGIDGKDFRGE
jgi:hypothetical protein